MGDRKHTATPYGRANGLFDAAEKLGLDGPTVDMVSEAINAAQSDAILWAGDNTKHALWYARMCAGLDPATGDPLDDEQNGGA